MNFAVDTTARAAWDHGTLQRPATMYSQQITCGRTLRDHDEFMRSYESVEVVGASGAELSRSTRNSL